MAVDPETRAIRDLAQRLLVLANNAYVHSSNALQHLAFGGKMEINDKTHAIEHLDLIGKTVDVLDDALYARADKGDKKARNILIILRGMRDPGRMNKGHIKDAQTSLDHTAQDYHRAMTRINNVAVTIVGECDSI